MQILYELNLIQEASLYFFATVSFLYILMLCGVSSLKQYEEFLKSASGFGLVMAFSVWCEYGAYFEVVEKNYERDYFVFVAFIFLVASICTIKKTSFPTPKKSREHLGQLSSVIPLMSRDQTEEWKGWMQFLFLMYHYFNAKEVYGPIRCLVSCYAFLTGYGNFLYFYKRKDFSFQRFLFMMWRLNFLTFVLMCCMDVPYILYYIVPLHTFYYCVTFAIMAIGKSWNDDRWKLSIKVMIAYGIIWFFWDGPVSEEIFELVFSPLRPLLAMDGSLHEWHFRSYLDHYSTLFGILFAMHIDQLTKFLHFAEQQTTKVEWLLKGIVLLVVGVVFWEWFDKILLLESRFDYNKFHPYFVAIPIITYIYVRNISPTLRSYHSDLCRKFGGLTLETYLMQYHLFLTSYTKMLLGFLPGYVLSNLVLTFFLLCVVAEYLFRWTMKLRDPVCKFASTAELKNKIGNLFITFAFVLTVAMTFSPPHGLLVSCLVVSIILLSKYPLPTLLGSTTPAPSQSIRVD